MLLFKTPHPYKKISFFTAIASIALTLIFIMSPVALAQSTPPDQQDRQAASQSGDLSNNPIIKDLNLFINFLSVGVGVVVIGMIILGGIQYSMAGDNPNALTAAKQRITNAFIALAAFLLLFAFLNWLIPGGIFN